MSSPNEIQEQPGIKQVSALPFTGSGGQSGPAKQMTSTSAILAGMQIQQSEDSKFDPKVKTGTYNIVKQGFCSDSTSYSTVMIVGILFIVYGIVSK